MVTPCSCKVFNSKELVYKRTGSWLAKLCPLTLAPKYKHLERTIYHLQECYCMKSPESTFVEAVFLRNLEVVKKTLKDHPEYAEAVDENGDTVLHIASDRCDFAMLQFFLDSKLFNINRRNARGHTPLALSSNNNKEPCVNLLLQHGANPNIEDENGKTALHLSARNGNVDMTSQLIKYNAKVNTSDAFGNTPLTIACLEVPNPDVVKILLDHGANPSLENDRLNCFMELVLDCTSRRKLDMVRVLLESGVDPNQVDRFTGKSCLHVAALSGFAPLCKLLLRYGADPNVVDLTKRTPYDVAVQHGNKEVAKLLKDYLAGKTKLSASSGSFHEMIPQKESWRSMDHRLSLFSESVSSL